MKKVVILIFAIFASQITFAGDQTGKVISIRVSSKTAGNPTHFQLDGVRNSNPACAMGWWAIDTDTAAGKSLLSVLLTAHSTSKTVTVWGINQCDLRYDMETAYQIGL